MKMRYQEIVMVHDPEPILKEEGHEAVFAHTEVKVPDSLIINNNSQRRVGELNQFKAELEILMKKYKVWQIWGMLIPEGEVVQSPHTCKKCGWTSSMGDRDMRRYRPEGDGWICECCW